MFHNDGIFSQSINSSSKGISTIASNLVMKEKRAISRILYCGPNPNGVGVVLYRIVELQYGENYLERLTFNSGSKVVDAGLFRVPYPRFHRYDDPNELEYRRNYKNNDFNLGVTSQFKELEGNRGTISSIALKDYRSNISIFSYPTLFLQYWKLKNYHK